MEKKELNLFLHPLRLNICYSSTSQGTENQILQMKMHSTYITEGWELGSSAVSLTNYRARSVWSRMVYTGVCQGALGLKGPLCLQKLCHAYRVTCLFSLLAAQNENASYVLRDTPSAQFVVRGRVTAPTTQTKVAAIHPPPHSFIEARALDMIQAWQ